MTDRNRTDSGLGRVSDVSSVSTQAGDLPASKASQSRSSKSLSYDEGISLSCSSKSTRCSAGDSHSGASKPRGHSPILRYSHYPGLHSRPPVSSPVYTRYRHDHHPSRHPFSDRPNTSKERLVSDHCFVTCSVTPDFIEQESLASSSQLPPLTALSASTHTSLRKKASLWRCKTSFQKQGQTCGKGSLPRLGGQTSKALSPQEATSDKHTTDQTIWIVLPNRTTHLDSPEAFSKVYNSLFLYIILCVYIIYYSYMFHMDV